MSSSRIVFIGRRPTAVRLAPRYTTEEWSLSSRKTHDVAESEREQAERLLAESIRITDETREISERAQEDVNWKFKQRLADIEQWRGELQIKYTGIAEEIDALTVYQQRVTNALDALDPFITTNNEILELREGRIDIDLVNDEPQKEILKEMTIISKNEFDLKSTIQFCIEQLRILRKCAYNLDMELKDKSDALEIDKLAHSLDEHRSIVQRQNFGDYSNVRDEEEWDQFTRRHKVSAEKVMTASIQLRTRIDSLLRQVCESLQTQVCITNAAFEKRLREIIDAKDKLQYQHEQVSIKVRETEDAIDLLTKAFQQRQSSAALAETRLNIRTRRPNLELVRDAVQIRLLKETQEMYASMENINHKIDQAKQLMKSLLSNQLDLEAAINVKLTTIAIEETQVLPLRKTIHVQLY